MIPIVYCGNNRVFEGLFLSALSVARRTAEPLEIIVLTMDYTKANAAYLPFTEEQTKIIDSAIKMFNPESSVKVIDLGEQFIEHFEGGRNLVHSYTPYALLRLFMDDENIVPFDKAIYLDIDVMACKDIKELWDIDLKDYDYAAVLDYLGKFWVARDYVNSGVMLLNLKKIRETDMFDRCRKTIYKNWYAMPDQSALYNCADKIMRIDGRFNEQRDIKPETVIKHFNRGIKWLPFFHLYNIKQWERDKVREKLKIFDFEEDYSFYDEFTKKTKEVKI